MPKNIFLSRNSNHHHPFHMRVGGSLENTMMNYVKNILLTSWKESWMFHWWRRSASRHTSPKHLDQPMQMGKKYSYLFFSKFTVFLFTLLADFIIVLLRLLDPTFDQIQPTSAFWNFAKVISWPSEPIWFIQPIWYVDFANNRYRIRSKLPLTWFWSLDCNNIPVYFVFGYDDPMQRSRVADW